MWYLHICPVDQGHEGSVLKIDGGHDLPGRLLTVGDHGKQEIEAGHDEAAGAAAVGPAAPATVCGLEAGTPCEPLKEFQG